TVLHQVGLWNVVEIAAADFCAEVDVAGRFLDRLQPHTLIFDELHRDLRYSPYDYVRACDLRNRVVAVLRQPFRIESLRALIVENMSEAVLPEKAHCVLELGRKMLVVPVYDGVDVFLEQNLQQGSGSAARPRTESACNFRRQISENRHQP